MIEQEPAFPATDRRGGIPADADAPAALPVLALPGHLAPDPGAVLQEDLCFGVLREGGAGYRVGGHRPL